MPCYHPLLRVQYYPQGHPNDTNVKVVPYVDDVKQAFFSQAKYIDFLTADSSTPKLTEVFRSRFNPTH